MKVLLTGATGYLGAHVAARIAAAGHTVRALARPGSEVRAPAGCRIVAGDLHDAKSLAGAVAGCDAVVHLAALVQRWVRDPREFDRVNVEGLAAVLRAAGQEGVEKIVYTSTIVALGPTDGEVRDETAGRTDFRFHTDYERSKWIALRLIQEKAAAGLPIVSVFPGIVYGPGAGTRGNLLAGSLERFLAGRLRARLGRGDRRICYSYAEDVAVGHLLALEKGRPGTGYILGGENATGDQFFGLLRELTGVTPPRISVPYWAAETAGRVLRFGAYLTGIPPLLTDGVAATFRHEWAYSSARAIRELGYAITPLRDGLGRTLEALRGVAAQRLPRGRS